MMADSDENEHKSKNMADSDENETIQGYMANHTGLQLSPLKKVRIKSMADSEENEYYDLAKPRAENHTGLQLSPLKSEEFLQLAPTLKNADLFKCPDHIKTSTTLQNEISHRIDPSKYCKLFRGYVRQDWDTINVKHGANELRAGWIDILFDLIFVACVVHISVEAAYSLPSADHRRLAATQSDSEDSCHSGPYDFILTCFSQFGLLSLFWMEQTMLDTHFVFNQQMDEILELFYFIFVLSTGLFIQNDKLYHVAFQLSYLCVRFVSSLIYLKAYLIPRARYHATWHIVINVIVMLALVCVASVLRGCPMDYFIVYCWFFLFEYCAFIMHSCITNKKGKLQFALALHVAHIAERFGLFVMLILGESILSIMTTPIGAFDMQGVTQIIFVILTFIMAYCIARLYFDCQPSEEAIMHGIHNHALRTNVRARILYIVSHHVLFFGLLGFGIGIKIAFKHFDDHILEKEWIDVLLPGYSLVLIIISLNIIRWSHPYKITSKLVWLCRSILVIIMAIIPIFAKKLNQGIVFGVFLFCLIALNLVDVEGRRNRQKIKEEMKEKRENEKKKSQHVGSKNVRGTVPTMNNQIELNALNGTGPVHEHAV